jgi:UDP-2,3-diacylglucosamine hydrolase
VSDEYLFISDCHLDASRPEVTATLVNFLETRAVTARYLYILGDLFEVWLGDDDPAPEHQHIIGLLRQLGQNTGLFFMAGNRDFLLGKDFAYANNITLLDEPHVLLLDKTRVVLVHGDILCTDDHDYQAFRSMVRAPEWQSTFLSKPLSERQQIAAHMRSYSVDAMAQKSMQIMDVDSNAVQNCFHDNGASIIIHGHTHRPAVHNYDANLSRIVLGDWGQEPSYLSWKREQGFKLHDPRI